MNRQQRRADAAIKRAGNKAETTRQVFAYLASEAAPSVTGATLIFPDGSAHYLSIADALKLYSDCDKNQVPQ